MSPLNHKRIAKLSRDQKKILMNRWIILSTLVIAISFLFPGGKALEYNYELGDITRNEIVAEFNFPILKEDDCCSIFPT